MGAQTISILHTEKTLYIPNELMGTMQHIDG